MEKLGKTIGQELKEKREETDKKIDEATRNLNALYSPEHRARIQLKIYDKIYGKDKIHGNHMMDELTDIQTKLGELNAKKQQLEMQAPDSEKYANSLEWIAELKREKSSLERKLVDLAVDKDKLEREKQQLEKNKKMLERNLKQEKEDDKKRQLTFELKELEQKAQQQSERESELLEEEDEKTRQLHDHEMRLKELTEYYEEQNALQKQHSEKYKKITTKIKELETKRDLIREKLENAVRKEEAHEEKTWNDEIDRYNAEFFAIQDKLNKKFEDEEQALTKQYEDKEWALKERKCELQDKQQKRLEDFYNSPQYNDIRRKIEAKEKEFTEIWKNLDKMGSEADHEDLISYIEEFIKAKAWQSPETWGT